MHIRVNGEDCRDLEVGSRLEWLLADGAGGFAMGTASGLNTRRYHGHLVAAINPPTDRMVLLDSVEAFAEIKGISYPLTTNQYPGAIHPEGHRFLTSFEATQDEVVWTFDLGGNEVSKKLNLTPEGCHITYVNHSKRVVKLYVRPLVCHKPYHDNFRAREDYPSRLAQDDVSLSIGFGPIVLRLGFAGATCQATQGWYYRFEHERESERGLDPTDDLFCPCELAVSLEAGESWTLDATHGSGKSPAIPVASPYLVRSATRTSIIAGYPWFTDWGRDTMISLPGICLSAGLYEEARQILRDYASQMYQGLIPNRFVESGEQPEYNTVDASLWFVNASYLTLKADWDEVFAKDMLVAIQEVVDWYRVGTLFGIGMDPSDGLISQGVEGLQLTWMDAKIGDWVVTPRRGKPVEINGLWIHALRVLAWLTDRLGGDGNADRQAADLAEVSFHRAFWNEELGWYRDTVDPISDLLRPNQVIPLALEMGPIAPLFAEAALVAIEKHLLTPRGVRTLATFKEGYRGRFEGPLPELDAAYHQGTAWPWLLGMYGLACQRVRGSHTAPDVGSMLSEYGLGGIAEVYDGDAPHRPGGCPWQAWSLATLVEAGWLGES